MGTRGSFPGIKWPGHEADQSPPPSAKDKMHGGLPPLPNTPSWHGALSRGATLCKTDSLFKMGTVLYAYG